MRVVPDAVRSRRDTEAMNRSTRSILRLSLAAVSLVLLAVVLGTLAWWFTEERVVASPGRSSAAIHVEATVDRIDTAANTARVTWVIEPERSLTDDGALRRDVVVRIPALSEDDIVLAKGSVPAPRSSTLELSAGDATAYPFDAYRGSIAVSAESEGTPLSTALSISQSDAGFTIDGAARMADDDASATVTMQRTLGTRTFAVFMAAVMWALALSAAIAAYVITRGRRGFGWPAMGWMAATLFALVAFRNAAPGAPPIGCLLDMTAFFWAEAVVVAALVWVVVRGLPIEFPADDA